MHETGEPRGPIRRAEVGTEQPGRGGVLLRVRDHGPGVAEDQLAHLAQPFYRPDAARQRSTGGVGLGLYLARLVAEAHGGALQLCNAQPGLEASLRLPLEPAGASGRGGASA